MNAQLFALSITLLITACAGPVPKIDSSQKQLAELPPIVSVSAKDGKRIPNGRSDSVSPYWRPPLQAALDPKYGLTKESAIRVGPRSDAALHIQYLNALRGPNGEPLAYERLGACCEFKPQNSPFAGGGLLDIYKVRVDGTSKDVFLFVNMYDPGSPALPAGFTQRK